jgi:hypothetical protein
MGRDDGGNVNNIEYKTNQNCYYESPHSEYILVKIYLKTDEISKRNDKYLRCQRMN